MLSLLSLILLGVSSQDCPSSIITQHGGALLNSGPRGEASFSPFSDLVNLTTHSQKINGRIHDNTTIFRHDPSPAVDEAWDHLSTEGYEVILVDETTVIKSGKSPHLSVKAPLSWGFGDGKYLAQIDVFHQIHCLNELRKEIHFDYYYGANWDKTSIPPEHAEHKKHCIHILLQNIMCHADVDIITHNWVHYENMDNRGRPYAEPLADFNLIKSCRDFAALLDWAFENAVDNWTAKWTKWEMPKDATLVHGDGYLS
ncbi:hypothetical protein MGU_08373 [Metarhizium guizhouense ARSEF 977]|uniref:Tat pathway signal sequence n=1 Tax=Metarhizium guizhouense (strain ARSEF 977) TaxID=1276136 RepID=A0A0B4H3Q5_METGA|nr:hypothetical protein MGU_08373 [Metarhizium guizhouense ARSEF 977]